MVKRRTKVELKMRPFDDDNEEEKTMKSNQYQKSRYCFKYLTIFRNHDHSLYMLVFSSCGRYLCGVGKYKQGKTMVVIWDVNL